MPELKEQVITLMVAVETMTKDGAYAVLAAVQVLKKTKYCLYLATTSLDANDSNNSIFTNVH